MLDNCRGPGVSHLYREFCPVSYVFPVQGRQVAQRRERFPQWVKFIEGRLEIALSLLRNGAAHRKPWIERRGEDQTRISGDRR